MKLKRIFTLLIGVIFFSCNDFLDIVPDRSLTVVTKIEEYQQLLNYGYIYSSAPGISELSTDNVYLTPDIWISGTEVRRNSYIWADDFYEGSSAPFSTFDWVEPYDRIYTANVVLDGLKDLNVSQSESLIYNEVKGQALFVRAIYHFFLQEIYGMPYKPESIGLDLSIPLKLSSDLTQSVSRATVQEAFIQIIGDLEEANNLLAVDYQAQNKNRASKAAVHALLSRVYLAMQNYEQSLFHSDECLSKYDKLLDFNQLSPSFNLPSPDNGEVLFKIAQNSHILAVNPIIDEALYNSYDENDLRKNVYFQLHEATNTQRVKTLYTGTRTPLSGLATDEIYINRAECRARLGDIVGAMDDLNKLLINRYENGLFVPLETNSPEEALELILRERRKELLFRGTRWTDLRRLNQDPKYAVTIKRNLNGVEYTLHPNSPKYTFPIPLNEVALSGIPQNDRSTENID
ncbi:RagB/SusD family nutrient uptake outer membrane protein [Parapedobacter koreensis]|uniref:SusD family protein n=1 Tax=Parapedobacter koreensis TaxID=332977 RepID=A0A1H7FJ56_9SPHI|nr:RagB/SusD family nutrient uptake outer membrane protein [Parapedobacter koreensis]SEK24150.1 SusD family protein [Parapedobacter koreensis]